MSNSIDTSKLVSAAARSVSAAGSSAAAAAWSAGSAVWSASAATAYGAASLVSMVPGGETVVNVLAGFAHTNASTATESAKHAEEASREAIKLNIGAKEAFPMHTITSKHGAAFLASMIPGGTSAVKVLTAIGSTRVSEGTGVAEKASGEVTYEKFNTLPTQNISSEHGTAFLANKIPEGMSAVKVLTAFGSTRVSEATGVAEKAGESSEVTRERFNTLPTRYISSEILAAGRANFFRSS